MKLLTGMTSIKSVAIIDNDLIRKSDAVVCLEGDGLNRLSQAIRLLKEGWAGLIVVSGGLDKPPFSIPAGQLAKELVKRGVPANKIILEEKSQDTYQQGKEVMKIVKKRKWRRIILVASHFHQYRAYLTFLKAMRERNLKIQIFNSPVRELSWFEKKPLGKNRVQLLEEEFKKIKKYTRKGHISTFKEVIEYQKWKEQKL